LTGLIFFCYKFVFRLVTNILYDMFE
jgi:hypothetical protein